MHETTTSIVRSTILMKELQSALRKPGEHLSDLDTFMNQLYYTLDDFLSYDDQTFILHLYIGILKRHPDQKALKQWVEELHNHTKTKKEILDNIRFSEEGIYQNVTILGLLPPKKRALPQAKTLLDHIKPIC